MLKPTTWLQNRVRLIIEIHTQLKRCHRRKNVKCVIINCRYERTRMRVGLPRYSGILLLNCIIMSVRCKIEILRVGDESANKSKIWGRNFALKNGTFRFWVCKILLRASERKKTVTYISVMWNWCWNICPFAFIVHIACQKFVFDLSSIDVILFRAVTLVANFKAIWNFNICAINICHRHWIYNALKHPQINNKLPWPGWDSCTKNPANILHYI
jgi:hypothetical protein